MQTSGVIALRHVRELLVIRLSIKLRIPFPPVPCDRFSFRPPRYVSRHAYYRALGSPGMTTIRYAFCPNVVRLQHLCPHATVPSPFLVTPVPGRNRFERNLSCGPLNHHLRHDPRRFHRLRRVHRLPRGQRPCLQRPPRRLQSPSSVRLPLRFRAQRLGPPAPT